MNLYILSNALLLISSLLMSMSLISAEKKRCRLRKPSSLPPGEYDTLPPGGGGGGGGSGGGGGGGGDGGGGGIGDGDKPPVSYKPSKTKSHTGSKPTKSPPPPIGYINSTKNGCPEGFKEAIGTIYASWPQSGSKECNDYSGCKWAGQFSRIDAGHSKETCKPGAEWCDGGDGTFACRWPDEKVRSWQMAATWDKKNELLGKKLEVVVEGGSGKSVTVNVGDECSDKDCNNCCSKNAMNGAYALIDLERWPASALLGFNPNTQDLDKVEYPTDKRPNGLIPLCYRIVGKCPEFK